MRNSFCFDPNCTKPAAHKIRDSKMCTEHYIEALEYSAHISSLVIGDDHPILVSMRREPKSTAEISEVIYG